jgi:hypothetical protein
VIPRLADPGARLGAQPPRVVGSDAPDAGDAAGDMVIHPDLVMSITNAAGTGPGIAMVYRRVDGYYAPHSSWAAA